MRPHTLHPWAIARWPLSIVLIASTLFPTPNDPETHDMSPSRAPSIVGPQLCAECHVDEHRAWQASSHSMGGKTLSRSPEAKAMAGALGIRRIKGEERCTTCHFTMQTSGSGRLRATSGVSCESCHGPASNWIEAHSDYGPNATGAHDESESHRLARLQHSQSMGMVHPGSLYELGSRCYTCHSIDDQELVGKAGHPTGAGFELVAWSQGEVRHNFSEQPHPASSERNPASSLDRRARMYVIGRGLELEFALRSLTLARPEVWSEARERVESAWRDMHAIVERLGTPALDELMHRMDSFDIASDTPTAELVSDIAELTRRTETELEQIDLSPAFKLLPDEEAYRGQATR